MARTITLADLRTKSRQRANKEGSGFIQNPELNGYINDSATKLYDLLVGAYGNDYYAKSASITTIFNQELYDVPEDFYKLLGIDYILGPQQFLTLKPYQFNERNRFRIGTFWNAIRGVAGPRYRLTVNKLSFLPVPDAGYNLELHYIPACPVMVDDTDTFDGINGWEEFIILDAAMKMLKKEETDTSDLQREFDAITLRINTMAENRDAGQSFRVTDVRGNDGYGGAYDGRFEGE